MNAIISYTKEVPVFKYAIGSLLVLFFLFGLLSLNYLSLIFLILGLGIMTTEGAELDLDAKTYRTVKSLFGIKFGKWQPNPKFDYVSVFSTHETQQVTVVTASASFREQLIVLNVFYGNKHFTFYKTKDKTDAMEKAKHIAMALEIDVLDATRREKIWLDKNLQPI
ncbi:hypothetical protein HUK80_05310 [Flavobacterium sp. MAH-1]|uniref:Uncharacterized protein n=1 Tax=Flavobacterium agri TaxID=2743471 RepID=A0A7Y8Y0G4_9FLAO|nr:hypothetical protein [Flavobacterium agri]NUY80304.1 hypothetical protein [Flavobacterium agri]NYA70329.1 hypothetical protein [Flavobacterium agri]